MLSDSEIGDLLVNYWKVEGKRGLLGKYAREIGRAHV